MNFAGYFICSISRRAAIPDLHDLVSRMKEADAAKKNKVYPSQRMSQSLLFLPEPRTLNPDSPLRRPALRNNSAHFSFQK